MEKPKSLLFQSFDASVVRYLRPAVSGMALLQNTECYTRPSFYWGGFWRPHGDAATPNLSALP
jgi:hypothetical protein